MVVVLEVDVLINWPQTHQGQAPVVDDGTGAIIIDDSTGQPVVDDTTL
jgi:hypothetical protein